MKKSILVYGFYNKGNIGDNLFVEAFKELFPQYNFIFTDKITKELLKGSSAIFFGGGSFLFSKPDISNDVIPLLKNIFYIGVGAETDIHPVHQQLIKQAKLIALRSNSNYNFIRNINPNVIIISDIVFALHNQIKISNKINKSILILPNISVVPQWNDEHWKHASWEYFKCEFSQFLDELINGGYSLKFAAMCQSDKVNDHWAAIEIINSMKNRNNYLLNNNISNISEISSSYSKFDLIISQRFHGLILAEMMNIPSINIHHHDKLKSHTYGCNLSYYNCSKQLLFDNFKKSSNLKIVLPIVSDIFEELKLKVNNLIG